MSWRLFITVCCVALLLSCEQHGDPAQNADNREVAQIRLGAAFSLSGFGAAGGEGELRGIRLALEEINASGGINGKSVELVTEDIRSDFKQTATVMQKLIDVDRLPVVLGPNWAEFSEIAAPIAQSKGAVMLTASGYTKGLTVGRDFVFTLMPAHKHAVDPLVDYVVEQKHSKAVLIHTHNAYFNAIAEAFQDEMKEKGSPLWKTIALNPEEKDYRSILTRLRKDDVDAVIVFLIEGGPTGVFLRQAREISFDKPIYSGPGLAYDTVVLEDKSIAEGVVFFDYDIPSTEEFRRKYAEKYEEDPHLGSSKAYDSLYLIKQSMEKCGESSEEIKRCLSSIEYKGASDTVRFDSDGNFAGNMHVTELRRVIDGEFKPFG